MTSKKQTPSHSWSIKQTIFLAAICLLAGIAGGWTIRATMSRAGTAPSQANVLNVAPSGQNGLGSPVTGEIGSREAVDAQAAPLLAQLQVTPNDPQLLTSLGNLYYDAQQYPAAIDYYGRVLKSRPTDAGVRTDMATAYWYMGQPDTAIAEFNKTLSYAPTNPNTLFNLGVVKWKGKRDAAGALAVWEKLLTTSPNYEGRRDVEQMMGEARQHLGEAARQ